MRAISTTSAVRARARGVIVLAKIARLHAIDIGNQIRARERRVLHGTRQRDPHDVREEPVGDRVDLGRRIAEKKGLVAARQRSTAEWVISGGAPGVPMGGWEEKTKRARIQSSKGADAPTPSLERTSPAERRLQALYWFVRVWATSTM